MLAMAKKKGNFSYIETQEALEAISTTATKESIPYDLLRIFCGYGDASLARVADGRGNDAKDGKTILIKKLLAYRYPETNVFGDGLPQSGCRFIRKGAVLRGVCFTHVQEIIHILHPEGIAECANAPVGPVFAPMLHLFQRGKG